MNIKTQVVIVGAGPTGLSLAVQFIRYNIDFVIIEKNEKTTAFSKAIAVQARTLEIFQQAGLAKKAIQEGRITNGMNIFYRGKRKAFINIEGLGDGLTPFPFALSLEQSKTEKLLADYLSENGKTIHWKSEFTCLTQNNEGVTGYYKNESGEETGIEAQYLVGCDGARSLVRHQLGFSFEGDTVPKIFYVTDVVLSSSVINKDEIFGFLIKGGFVLFFPMEGTGHYRVIGILTDKKEEDANITFEDIEEFVKTQIISPVNFEKVNWFSTYKVHSRKATSFMEGRCFIAGDAAHIHTPAGGQGMNTGIQDGYNLAWKIAYVINGKLSPSVLETYNTERTKNAKQLLNTTDRMFDIMAGTNWFWNFVRLKIFPLIAGFVIKNRSLNKRLFPLISETGISYSDSALTLKSSIGKVRAGDRMHYFVFSDRKNIFDYLDAPSFKILFFGSKENNFDQLKNLKFKVDVFSFNEIPENIFGNSSDFYVLLRPDNHISYVGYKIEECKNALLKYEAGRLNISQS